MRHPFEYCATKYCCFCLNFDPEVTCYIISCMCISINAFAGCTNVGVGHWVLYVFSMMNLLLHLFAGVMLFLGTIWGKDTLKLGYCWLLLLCLFTVITGLILHILFNKDAYVIWQASCKKMGLIYVIINSVWLIVWDVYTPMIVLGNLEEVDEM